LLIGSGTLIRHRTLSNAANKDICSGGSLQPIKKFKMHAEKSTVQAMPMVGFDAMARAKSTLEDFVCILCSWYS
jgi:hypothetical protein